LYFDAAPQPIIQRLKIEGCQNTIRAKDVRQLGNQSTRGGVYYFLEKRKTLSTNFNLNLQESRRNHFTKLPLILIRNQNKILSSTTDEYYTWRFITSIWPFFALDICFTSFIAAAVVMLNFSCFNFFTNLSSHGHFLTRASAEIGVRQSDGSKRWQDFHSIFYGSQVIVIAFFSFGIE